MSAITAEQQNALTLTERAAIALGETVNAAKLRALAEQSKGIVAINSADGREEAHRAAMVLRTTRNNITNTGKAAREDATAFSKAVIAMEREMIAIIEPEEERVIGLRDAWDAKIAAEKAAKIAAERARVEGIQARINAVRNIPAGAIGKSAAQISQMIYELAGTISEDDAHAATFEEFAAEFKSVRTEVLERLAQAEKMQLDIEAAAAEVERVRLAEIQRLADERAELARLRAEQAERDRLAKIESDRVAGEQAAKQKALAEAEAELRRKRDEAEAQARAEQAKRDRAAQAAADKVAAAEKALADREAEFQRRIDEAAAAEAKAKQDAIDAEAAREQAAKDAIASAERQAAEMAEQEARRAEKQVMADQAAADARGRAADEHVTGLPTGALAAEAIADALLDELYPEDSEIVDAIRSMFMREFNMDAEETDVRMQRFNYAGALAAMSA